MNKSILAILTSIFVLAGCVSSQSHMDHSYADTAHEGGHKQGYITDGAGSPVKVGGQCILAGTDSGTYFEECDSSKMAKMQHGQTDNAEPIYQPVPAPKPRVITRVIVDCARCPK